MHDAPAILTSERRDHSRRIIAAMIDADASCTPPARHTLRRAERGQVTVLTLLNHAGQTVADIEINRVTREIWVRESHLPEPAWLQMWAMQAGWVVLNTGVFTRPPSLDYADGMSDSLVIP